MQIRNDYDKEVFNGDIGRISRVDMEERELTVNYDGREVVYDQSELDELTLAYAITIHKAQGSEYPIVVMPFTMSHFVMLQRNLLYTGVTRAKKILVLIGEKRAVSYAIRNETTKSRNTKLAQRLAEGKNTGKMAEHMQDTSFKNNNANDCNDSIMQKPEKTSDLGNKRNSDKSQEFPRKKRKIVYKGEIRPSVVSEQLALYHGNLFQRLAQSKFRSSFSLKANDRAYVAEKGIETIRTHAQDFIRTRLAPAFPKMTESRHQ